SIDSSTLKSVSQIREEAAGAVGLVLAYGRTKKEQPTAKSPPEPDEQAETPEDSEAIIARITELEKKWEASARTHDTTVVEAILSEDFGGLAPSGRITDKAWILFAIANDTWSYEIARVEEIHVKVVDRKTAIATGTGREKGKDARHKPFDR